MALTHLVDTSVLARLDRPRIRSAIEAAAVRGELARAGVSDLEIGYVARNGVGWDRLMAALKVFELVETTSEHLARARQVQRLLAVRRQRGRRLPDLLVAAAAEARSLTVLHYDASFDRIAAVTGQPCEWVVAPGSAD